MPDGSDRPIILGPKSTLKLRLTRLARVSYKTENGHAEYLVPLSNAEEIRSAQTRRLGDLPELTVTVPRALVPLPGRKTCCLIHWGVPDSAVPEESMHIPPNASVADLRSVLRTHAREAPVNGVPRYTAGLGRDQPEDFLYTCASHLDALVGEAAVTSDPVTCMAVRASDHTSAERAGWAEGTCIVTSIPTPDVKWRNTDYSRYRDMYQLKLAIMERKLRAFDPCPDCGLVPSDAYADVEALLSPTTSHLRCQGHAVPVTVAAK